MEHKKRILAVMTALAMLITPWGSLAAPAAQNTQIFEENAPDSSDADNMPDPENPPDAQEPPGEEEPDAPYGTEITSGDYIYMIMETGAVIVRYHGMDAEVEVPDALGGVPVSAIGTEAFAYNPYLEKIALPDTVTIIGLKAFFECEALREVTHWPEALAGIGVDAFRDCESLGELYLPAGTGFIGDSAFSGCRALRHIVLPESLYDIGPSAFSGCSLLEDAAILGDADTGTIMEEYAPFAGCRMLERIVYGGSEKALQALVPASIRNAAETLLIAADMENETVEILAYIASDPPYIVLPVRICGLLVTGFGRSAFPGLVNIPPIYYAGTKAQWQDVSEGEGNAVVLSQTVCVGREEPIRPVWNAGDGRVTGLSFADLAGIPVRGVDFMTADWQKMPEKDEEIPDDGGNGPDDENLPEDEPGTSDDAPDPDPGKAIVPEVSDRPSGSGEDSPEDPEEAPAWAYSFFSSEDEGLTPYDILGTGMYIVRRAENQETEDEQAQIVLLGDVLGTGRLDISQVVRIARALTGEEPLEGACLAAADLNGTGGVDVADLVMETQWLAGRMTPQTD